VPLAELEASRKRTLLAIGISLFLAGALLFISFRRQEWFFFVIILSLVPFLAFFALSLIEDFRARVKKALVAPLAEALGFRYSPGQGFPEKEALASGLFLSHPHSYASEDLVEGEVNGIPFASFDITLYRALRPADGLTMRKFFRGTLYRFHLPFSVEGEVRFGPRSMGMGVVDRLSSLINVIAGGGLLISVVLAVLGKLSAMAAFLIIYVLLGPFILQFLLSIFDAILERKGRKSRFGQVTLESPEFERFYDAYGEDPVEARKLLTPRVQEALVRLRKYFDKPVWGAARGRELWLLVGRKDRFPVPIFRPVSKTFEIEKARYQEELSEVYRVVEALRLEEEAKRKGVWRRKLFTGWGESSSVPKKESASFDGDQPQQAEDTPKKGYRLFTFLPNSREVKDVPGEPRDF
jgi:hypothetical protein